MSSFQHNHFHFLFEQETKILHALVPFSINRDDFDYFKMYLIDQNVFICISRFNYNNNKMQIELMTHLLQKYHFCLHRK